HHATNRMPMFYSKGNRGRRCRIGRQHHLEVVPRENFRRPLSEFIRKKSAIITDYHFLLCSFHRIGAPIVRCRLCHSLQVCKRKILGDHRPPTVRPKFDLHILSAVPLVFSLVNESTVIIGFTSTRCQQEIPSFENTERGRPR